ncbi:hypothetical protein CEP69_03845 [Citrobacter braakii]|uniref:Uncharacterized protein n=1 Tax=Citrobacter braakii TaxID=57706 RepID=A0AA44LE48_CITBR|nr:MULTISPECIES: hypothetical protein [Citrobacter]ASE41971.1 hypothetical protein CEP69_03845 [Citrobacter braakii]OLY68398.1 hypothetical protein BWD41_16575 [Citrobacter braakii]TCC61454.1 hypothetical protein EY918_03835 [Citrobacter braakii]TKU40657.1 hypothetical protein FDX24_10045 [Citrobacter sp. wls716]WFZ46764.1 hypothetical protein NFK67_14210 [Citrobacter braakii]
MATVRVRKIKHPGGTETFQGAGPYAKEWTDIFIGSGCSDADVEDFNRRIDDWISEREKQGDEVIWVPNY